MTLEGLTPEAVNQRVDDLKDYVDTCIENIGVRIGGVERKIDDGFERLQKNDLAHIQEDIRELRKAVDQLKAFMWKLIGGIGAIWAIFQLVIKNWDKIFK